MARRASKPGAADADAALRAAIRLLAIRDRSRAEIERRLTASGFDADAVRSAVSRLSRRGWVDDTNLARSIVAEEVRRGPAGDKLLAAKLDRREIPAAAAAKALRNPAVQPESRRAEQAAREAVRRLPATLSAPARWRKVLGVLARRGFDEETARGAAEAALGAPPEAVDS